MAHRLTVKQMMGWYRYSQIEPLPSELANWLAAGVRERVHNLAVTKEYREPVEKFLLTFDAQDEVKPTMQTPEDQILIAKMWKEYAEMLGNQ